MGASPPALWLCFKHKEVAGQTLMGTCHLNLCPTPLKYLTRYPTTKDTLLKVTGHNCITFHHCMLAGFGNVFSMGMLLHLNYHSDTKCCKKERRSRNAQSTLTPRQVSHSTLSSPRKTAPLQGQTHDPFLEHQDRIVLAACRHTPSFVEHHRGSGEELYVQTTIRDRSRLEMWQMEELCWQVISATTGAI